MDRKIQLDLENEAKREISLELEGLRNGNFIVER